VTLPTSPLNTVPIPARMAHLPLDRRGYPIPWIVMRDATGRPHFTINDHNRVHQCGKFGLCGICGKPLGKYLRSHGDAKPPAKGAFFVGGPASFYHDRGAFLDPPLHRECAVYAMRVCPYIANPSYGKRIDDATLKPEHMPAGMAVIQTAGNPPSLDTRPQVFILGLAKRWEMFEPRPGTILFKVPNHRRDWVHMSAWRHGVELDIESREVKDEIFRRLMAAAQGSA
jgi:hypothetical protein